MKPSTKLTSVVQAKPPVTFPDVEAMTPEQLVEKIKLALEHFYGQGLYSRYLAYLARAMVLLVDCVEKSEASPVLNTKLTEAVRNLYYAAVWHADRPVDAEGLWTAVRDAAGFEPSQSPEPAGVKMIAVPLEHVAAIEATLGYLVK